MLHVKQQNTFNSKSKNISNLKYHKGTELLFTITNIGNNSLFLLSTFAILLSTSLYYTKKAV